MNSSTCLNCNGTANTATEEQQFIMAVKIIRNICIPLISAVGFFGNTLSLLVFSTQRMRRSSCSMFLASLALVDNLFLLSLMITWVDSQFYHLLIYDLPCQMIVFITYVASFLSVWFIVGFTCERYFAICHPLKSNFICSVLKEKLAVIVLTVTACVLYNFSFWTVKAYKLDYRKRCQYRFEFIDFLQVVTWVDTVVTMIIPFVIIVYVNSNVLKTAMRFVSKHKQRYFRLEIFSSSKSHNSSKLKSEKVYGKSINKHNIETRSFKNNPHYRVTRTLLLVSTTFLCLNLPSHAIRLHNLIAEVTSGNKDYMISVQFFFIREMALLLYYCTFSCNFVLYTMFGRNFKHSLYALLRCKTTKHEYKEMMLERLSSTQGTPVSPV